MTRTDLQTLSRIRLREAYTLLQNGQYDGVYYLSGYAVECALKACIAKQTKRFEFPDRQQVIDSWTHNLEALLRVTQLQAQFEQDRKTDNQLDLFWAVVREWRETSRYERHTEQDARDIYRAISDARHGVLRWLRGHW